MKNCILYNCLWFSVFFILNPLAGQNAGVGTVSPLAKLHIKGSENNPQLIIDANNTQTNAFPLIKLRSSFGSDLLWMHSDTAFNIFIGFDAGKVNNAVGGGVYNTFIGKDAGNSNTTGSSNTVSGANAFSSNTTGSNNSVFGSHALFSNTTGSSNLAHGFNALYSNTTGFLNTASGYEALYSNTTGKFNSANGAWALYSNTTGLYNSAYGIDALYSNISGAGNTASGNAALYSNISGYLNSAQGYLALTSNTTGYENTAHGSYSIYSNSTGSQNTALGHGAMFANTTGTYNTAVGYNANVSSGALNNATAIGANAYAEANNSVVIGSINGINGATASANVGIGTSAPNPKAILEIKSTSQGVLFPTMTTAQRNAIVSPPNGLHIFNSDHHCLNYYDAIYQFWDCYCESCAKNIIHISEDTCSINFYNDYYLEDPASEYFIVIDSGVTVSNCGSYSAMDFYNMTSPAIIKIFNYGTIEGFGGYGGPGSIISMNACISSPAGDGNPGGHAIWTKAGVIIEIQNHGIVAGGGGGGGGGDANPSGYGGGGGGGAGIDAGGGGSGGGTLINNCVITIIAEDGDDGTDVMGGAGGTGASGGGSGGNGGGRAQPGQNGTGQNPGLGGPAGKAIHGGSGNSITNIGAGQSFGVID